MRIVLNKCYGGFAVSTYAWATLGIDPDDLPSQLRVNPALIEALTEFGADTSVYNGPCAKLVVVEIPRNTTDWHVIEYDGYEQLVYVVNGKLHFA